MNQYFYGVVMRQEAKDTVGCYLPLALREDNRQPIMLLATLGSVTLA